MDWGLSLQKRFLALAAQSGELAVNMLCLWFLAQPVAPGISPKGRESSGFVFSPPKNYLIFYYIKVLSILVPYLNHYGL